MSDIIAFSGDLEHKLVIKMYQEWLERSLEYKKSDVFVRQEIAVFFFPIPIAIIAVEKNRKLIPDAISHEV